jgi:DNA-binding transcriptional MerR regulator
MKKGHRLGELSKLLDLQPYVLRYWLTEFPQLRGDDGGSSGSSGNRLFSADEVALLRRIKGLLYDEGYTIAGAKKKLESEPPEATAAGARRKATPLFDDDAAAESDEAPRAAAAESPPPLDTRDEQRIETLRLGLAKALDEARAILDLLNPRR